MSHLLPLLASFVARPSREHDNIWPDKLSKHTAHLRFASMDCSARR